MWVAFLSNATEEDRNSALDAYLTILDRTPGNKEVDPETGDTRRCGYIPQELEDYWLRNWERLELKGRHLCRSANDPLRDAIEAIQEAKKRSTKYKLQ